MDKLELQEFNYLVELFRFYLGLVLETVTFVLGVTGAVVAYVLQDGRSPSRWPGLIVPCALCVFVGAGFLAATPAAWELKLRVDALAKLLAFGLAPHTSYLAWSLAAFGALLILVGVGLLWAAPRYLNRNIATPNLGGRTL